jgi:lysophospholipase L1-like esterase
MARSGRSPLRAAARALAAIGLSLAIALSLAEAVLWLGLPLAEGQSQRLYLSQTIPGVKREIVYDKNAFGFRSLSMRDRRKPAGTLRVLCLGASTTDQPTQSTEDIWSAILEKKLTAEFAPRGVRVEVAAMGVGGQTAGDRLNWARAQLTSFEPDLLVTLEGVNDLTWHGGPGYHYDGSFPQKEAELTWLDRCTSLSQLCRRLVVLRNRFRLERALERGRSLEWHSQRLPERRAEYRGYPFVEAPVRDPDPIVEFSDAMRALLGFATAHGVPTIVLAQPTLWKPQMSPDEEAALWFFVSTPSGRVRPSTAWLEREMERYNGVQRELAERAGARYVPLDTLVPKSLEFFFDDCHYTDRGNQAVAEAVYPAVSEALRKLLAAR